MSEPPAPRRSFTGRLGFRLAFLLAIALLPLGFVSVMQTASLAREARARSEAALTGETLRAASAELRVIQLAQGMAEALAIAMPDYLGDDAACSATMRKVAAQGNGYSLVGYFPLSGITGCSSLDRRLDFSQSALFKRYTAEPKPSMIANPRPPLSGESILGISHPVFDADGDYIGVVSISVPHRALRSAAANHGDVPEPISLITFDAEGNVLTSSGPIEEAQLRVPADRPLKSLASDRAVAFTGFSNAGFERVFSVVPLVEGQLFALGTWPAIRQSSFSILNSAPYLFPALMWLASLVVALLAAEHLVIRYIRKLRESIVAFTGGARMIGSLNIDNAPNEIRDVGEAYLKMTDTILHDEAELEDTVHQKEVLLREVHHRVKNNLQLIASIMNMQMRQARSPEAKSLMLGLQERVMSLATVHRGLYMTTGLTDVRADELLRDIVRQIVSMGSAPGRRYDLHTYFDDLRLTPDQAVPLSLLLTEAMTNAMKYAGSDTGTPRLDVSLRRMGGTFAVLEVANTLASHPQSDDTAQAQGTGLGSQLLSAFAMQIGGKTETTQTAERYTLRIQFTVSSLITAEQSRNAAELAQTNVEWQ